ncbi:MAG: arsenosugar biosynthesis radical SAM protein ArsS [Proteobacteria bacterium]|nr:arsenosugar biosynthesis radical SAM protein ArsS [Pseudomonadota bacterium]
MAVSNQLATLNRCPVHFTQKLAGPVYAAEIEVLQLNVGKRCNLFCRHCHVEAGDKREEVMSSDILDLCLKVIRENSSISVVDITGGAPEMNPGIKKFIEQTAKLGRRLIVRSNLAILAESQYSDFTQIYTQNKVEIVASLPDCDENRADRQRGKGFFRKFIQAAKILNENGYGKAESGLVINLVHNPLGAYLPASQKSLEQNYKQSLKNNYDIDFNTLFCINNMPVGRYLDFLLASGNYDEYMFELLQAFNPEALENVMCRTMVSVAWNGSLFDCDFNQMLNMPISSKYSDHISRFDIKKLCRRPIALHNHCYGCTAGAGSSCQGALE